MKKHDEGYVLAYVTVVLLVFCLVATTILTGALRNLNHQQNSIAQMKDQYVAEGLIEQVVAKLDNKGNIDIAGDGYTLKSEDGTVIATLTVSAKDKVLTLQAQSGSATVVYALKLTASSVSDTDFDNFDNTVEIENLTAYTFIPVPTETDENGGEVQ